LRTRRGRFCVNPVRELRLDATQRVVDGRDAPAPIRSPPLDDFSRRSAAGRT